MKLETESRAPKGNTVYINRLNKIEVLGQIREEKLVESIGIGDSSGGRPPVMLKFKGEESYLILNITSSNIFRISSGTLNIAFYDTPL